MKRLVSVVATSSVTLATLLAVNAASADPAPKAVPTITIKNFAYTGALKVHPGVKVKVVNADSVPHTFTNLRNIFDTGSIPAGGSKTFTAPSRVANYKVKCTFHSSMSTVLKVVS